ncbi:MAG: HDOD domain-containing protein [Pseudomonadales bacterium]
MSELAAQIHEAVSTALLEDELELPVLPEVALNIREEAERDSVSVNSLAEVISADAGLVARLIKVVNSPMFRASRVIDELPAAISRLGLEYAANLATGIAMKQMFQATSEHVDRVLRSTWSHSSAVAALSGTLAKERTNLRMDQAMLAGLTHSIGALPILSWAEEHDHLVSDSITLERVIASIHGSIGTMILQRWQFPEEIAMVPSHYQDYARHSERADFISVVTVANILAKGLDNYDASTCSLDDIDAFAKLRIDPQNEDLIEQMIDIANDGKAALG